MESLIKFIQNTGTASIDMLWLPVVIWTIAALLMWAFIKLLEHKISPSYHYHSRVALLWSLAAGLIASALLYYFPFGASTGAPLPTTFIVIQNPIPVTAGTPSAGIDLSEPMIWIGLLTTVIVIAALIGIAKLIASFSTLRAFSGRLQNQNVDLHSRLNELNRQQLSNFDNSIRIFFSEEVSIPCTFGCFNRRIVLPKHLLQDNTKLNMALRHELTHIANNDYLLNTSVQFVKACFFFHPLVHKMVADIEEYREITCDQYVLQDANISQKKYAQLLFEFSPKPVFRTSAAVSMAVDPSTLKKRIQTMKNSTQKLPSLKWSISFMLVTALMVTGLMACSDIEEGGITGSEVQEVQANIDKTSSQDQPLFLIDDKKVNKKVISRLKPKYIESIEILKGEEATDAYGNDGKKGVVLIKLNDKEKALNDLSDEVPPLPLSSKKSDKGDFYIAVENPPKLKGGIRGIMQKIQYPKECKEAGIEGRVVVQFIVNEQGQAENPNIIRGIGGSCDEEALRVIKQAKFEPGTQDGKPVSVQMSIPIMFRL